MYLYLISDMSDSISDCSILTNEKVNYSSFIFRQMRVGSESGGKLVKVSPNSTFDSICLQAFGRPIEGLVGNLSDANLVEVLSRLPTAITYIGARSVLFRCSRVINSIIGQDCLITGGSTEIESSIISSRVVITSSNVKNSIIQSDCAVVDGGRVSGVFMCESARVGEGARVHDSIVGPDSSIEGGECHVIANLNPKFEALFSSFSDHC